MCLARGSEALEAWLKAALDYISRWLDYQMRATEQPGCVIAVHASRPIGAGAGLRAGRRRWPATLDSAPSLSRRLALEELHRCRNHEAARGGPYYGLTIRSDSLSRVCTRWSPKWTLGQLLSHSAGLIRDGADAGQWQDRRPFASEAELKAALAEPPVIDGSTRFKYSNHGFGLLGMVIEQVTGEPYRDWIRREIVRASKLEETEPDGPVLRGTPVARGHSGKLPLGRRVVVPGDNPTRALAPATGFVSTAGDLAPLLRQPRPGRCALGAVAG